MRSTARASGDSLGDSRSTGSIPVVFRRREANCRGRSGSPSIARPYMIAHRRRLRGEYINRRLNAHSLGLLGGWTRHLGSTPPMAVVADLIRCMNPGSVQGLEPVSKLVPSLRVEQVADSTRFDGVRSRLPVGVEAAAPPSKRRWPWPSDLF